MQVLALQSLEAKMYIGLQEKRLAQEIADIERDTGFKLRVLAQNYPDTPGMHIINLQRRGLVQWKTNSSISHI